MRMKVSSCQGPMVIILSPLVEVLVSMAEGAGFVKGGDKKKAHRLGSQGGGYRDANPTVTLRL